MRRVHCGNSESLPQGSVCVAARWVTTRLTLSMAERFIKIAEVGGLPPGKMRRVEVGGRRILLANVDGFFYATDDACTHEDASLSTGSLNGEWVKCPLHGSRFSVRSGEVVDEPAEVNLRIYAVRVVANGICVDLDSERT